MSEKVTKLALASRVIVAVLQLITNTALPDHKNDVFRAPLADNNNNKRSWLDKTIDFTLGGFRHWDGEYFLHIAEYGYSYENTLAFYPLYPIIVEILAKMLHYLMDEFMCMRSCCLLMAVLLNVVLFCKAANILYVLTQRIFNDLNKSWNVVLLFCFNPASIFFSAAYSESLFCLLTFYIMLECCMEIRFVRSSLALALNIIARSNGLVNFGFPVYFLMRKYILKQTHFLANFLKLLACLLLALIPWTFFNFFAFRQFCYTDNAVNHTQAVLSYAREKQFVLAGQRLAQHSTWCDNILPFPYSYIQSHYWQVGFLKYYEFKQLPNFLLALPILSFLSWHCFVYLRHFIMKFITKYPLALLIKEYKTLPFVLHSTFLTLFCIFFVHIQISTRLLCSATPTLYWFAADYMPKSLDKLKLKSKAGLIFVWFAFYVIVGTLLFSNNLPWT
ncbi:GPI mannosyltransferase 2 [Lucilia cuprina]|uniref:GPI mannosyltransferase 2 n=1 Tax=Lucilia cuprina TaxID=7375 RepID=UPI001F05BDCA|nr:GPI mannosyltransferase 2 [Lucilia cuprina]